MLIVAPGVTRTTRGAKSSGEATIWVRPATLVTITVVSSDIPA